MEQAAFSEEEQVEPKRAIWSFGLQGVHYKLKGEGDVALSGTGGSVSLGRGYTGDSWYGAAQVEFLLGPYSVIRDGQFDAEFSGTGFSLRSAYALYPWADLRNSSGTLLAGIGVRYTDQIGKSVGRNRRDTGSLKDNNAALPERFRVAANILYLTPTIAYASFKPSRPDGNSPELLTTRVEGQEVSFGVSIPIYAQFKAVSYEIPEQSATASHQDIKWQGTLKGTAFTLGWTLYLGS
jgi:hypothetical protein